MTTSISVKEQRGGTLRFDRVRAAVQQQFDLVRHRPQFRTVAYDLYELFRLALPEEHQQHYDCAACRAFVNKFGRLVTIDEEGKTQSSMFCLDEVDSHNIDPIFIKALAVVRKKVESLAVQDIFFSEQTTYGTPESYENETGYGDRGELLFQHFHAIPSPGRVHKAKDLTAGQRRGQSVADHQTIKRALAEFSIPVMQTAVDVLNSEAVDRSERYRDPAKWLLQLAQSQSGVRDHKKANNLVWLAIADKPDGYLHPRSGMLGQLLEGLKDGKSVEYIKRGFNEKVASDKLMRPTKAPSEGQINQAEKLVSRLGIETALPRKFARRIDYPAAGYLWKAPVAEKKAEKPADGVFGSLRQSKPAAAPLGASMNLGAMSFAKFRTTHLADAAKIEVMTTREMQLGGITDAVNADSEPIFKWDDPKNGRGNKFSWYVYTEPQTARSFGLPFREWVKVDAIVHSPWMIHGAPAGFPPGVMWLLKGAQDIDHENRMGLGLFPEIMRSELHSVRKTIEAFSNTNDLQGFDEGDMFGIPMQSHLLYPLRVTTTGGSVKLINIDRWE